MSGWLIENSTIDGAAKGLLLGGGRRNRVIGNRFANVAGPAILLDNRGLNWQLKNCKSTAPTSLGGRVKARLRAGVLLLSSSSFSSVLLLHFSRGAGRWIQPG